MSIFTTLLIYTLIGTVIGRLCYHMQLHSDVDDMFAALTAGWLGGMLWPFTLMLGAVYTIIIAVLKLGDGIWSLSKLIWDKLNVISKVRSS